MSNPRTRINQWLALVITDLVLGACSLMSPTQALSPGWITVQGNLVSFQVPSKWNATASLPGDESNEEGWLLDIPEADHASIAFSGAGLERFHPPSELLISEEFITIGTQPGFKWVRFVSTAKDQIVYEYMTTGPSGKGIFGLSVVMQAQDPEIEQLLDQLIESVIFSKSKSQSLFPSENLLLSSTAKQAGWQLYNNSRKRTPIAPGFRSSPESFAEWRSHSARVITYDNSFRRRLAQSR